MVYVIDRLCLKQALYYVNIVGNKKKYMTNVMHYRLYLFGSTKIWFAVNGIHMWSLLITLLD